MRNLKTIVLGLFIALTSLTSCEKEPLEIDTQKTETVFQVTKLSNAFKLENTTFDIDSCKLNKRDDGCNWRNIFLYSKEGAILKIMVEPYDTSKTSYGPVHYTGEVEGFTTNGTGYRKGFITITTATATRLVGNGDIVLDGSVVKFDFDLTDFTLVDEEVLYPDWCDATSY